MGIFTIQLAKAAGYKVVATASPHNFDLVKSYGADEIVDYSDADKAVEQIKQITGGGVTRAVDLISLEDSVAISLKSFKEGSDNKLRLTLPQPESTKTIRPDVDVVNTLAYTAFGKAFQFTPNVALPAIPQDRAFHEELVKITPQLIKDYNLRPPPTDVRPGLESIEQAFDEMKVR
jgi:NADPH:quinone reductase-like Zn-dependent oxidoreductase